MITDVVLARAVTKGLKKLPQHVGLETARKIPGYHDEPLSGDRAGQRSIRLSRAYRAFYTIEKNAVRVKYVLVLDVNKHDY